MKILLGIVGGIIGICLFGLLMYCFAIVLVCTSYNYSIKKFLKESIKKVRCK